jgi:hypothetical protein
MIEEGLYKFIQAGINNATIPGYPVELPANAVTVTTPQAWSYRGITSIPTYYLSGQDAFTRWTVQLDLHGFTMAAAQALARIVIGILSGGYRGTFTDVDSTVVLGIFLLPSQVDGFSDISRTFIRSIEVEIQYYATI